MHINIAYSTKGVTSTELVPKTVESFELFSKSFNECKTGGKNGAYFVRAIGTIRGNSQLAHNSQVLIIDGDSSLDGNGNVVNGAPDPKAVHKLLTGLGINHLIHTTSSHGKYGLNKYRLIINCEYEKYQLIPTVQKVIDKLHSYDLMINNVPENNRWAQAWFMPRHDNPESFHFYCHLDGRPMIAVGEKPEEVLLPTFKLPPVEAGVVSPISLFNAYCGTPTAYLATKGYTWQGNRMMRPGGTVPGIVVCDECRDGLVRVISHGGDALNTGNALSAFDCFTLLEFEGDVQAGMECIRNNLKVGETGLTINEYNAMIRAKIEVV